MYSSSQVAAPGAFARGGAASAHGGLSRRGTGVMPGPASFHAGVHGAPNGAGLGGGVGGPAAPASGLFKGAAPLPAPNGFQTVMSAARTDGPVPTSFNAWDVVGVLGRGVFGDIYQVAQPSSGQAAACKVEPHDCPRKLLRIETEMMQRLCSAYSVPRVLETGSTGFYEWVVMELVGASLAELRSALCGVFSPSTALKLAFKALNCLEEMHMLGIVHGDVKPGNFAMGVGEEADKLYVIDFGLSREFPKEEHKANFRGTVKYASLHAHERLNVTARDDLWSWFYMVVEWTKGELPWTHLCMHPDQPRNEVYRTKRDFDSPEFVCGLPQEFDIIRRYLQTLEFNELPDYDYMYRVLTGAHGAMGCDWNQPLDWDTPRGSAAVQALKAQFGKHPFVPTGGIGRTTILEGGVPSGPGEHRGGAGRRSRGGGRGRSRSRSRAGDREIGDRETETREIGARERTRSRSRSAVRPAGSRGSRRASVAPVSEW